MSTGQAIGLTVAIIVSTVLLALTMVIVAVSLQPAPTLPPILTVLNCPTTCEVLV